MSILGGSAMPVNFWPPQKHALYDLRWLGDFHDLPVLSHDAERPSQMQRSLLALYGLILGMLQGRVPSYGILIHGQGCEVRWSPLPSHDGQARWVVQGLYGRSGST